MPPNLFRMFPRCARGFAWLICGFIMVCESASGARPASRDSCSRQTCNGIKYDIHQAVCCENEIHPGEGLSCCGKQPFNPASATCCKVGHGHDIRAHVTQGLSEQASTCCGLEAYNAVNEICCESTIIAKPAPMAQCCGKDAIDKDKQLCCGTLDNKLIVTKESIHHKCCGHKQFNTKSECCCWHNHSSPEIRLKDSTAQTPSLHNNQKLCCQSTVVAKPAAEARHCGQQAFDEAKQLCCGPDNDKKILHKESIHHQCCGHNQFNTKTRCCCWKNNSFTVMQPTRLNCCPEESGASDAKLELIPAQPGVQQQKLEAQPKCMEPNSSSCGSLCYNPNEFRCCERNQATPRWSCNSGQYDAVPAVYDTKSHVCCNGCVSVRKPWMDQCCGEKPYSVAQRGVLCCNNTLYKDREDGEECSDVNVPYNPAKGTICCSQFHDSPGQHCCAAEVFRPQREMCCNGHRHLKRANTHCCGIQAYNIKDRHMKCCAGILYNLTSFGKDGGDVQCCGSVLQSPQEVCCASEDKEVHYSAKTGHKCCGHRYYNASLWSCCAGRLSAEREPGQHQSKMINELLSVNNLNDRRLCKEMHVGTVESVSRHSIVFSNVMKIHGRHATVKPLPSYYILQTPDHCNSPKLTPGKFYFFDEDNVFADYNHDFVFEAFRFIISKCSL